MLLILTGTSTGSLELAGDVRATFEASPGPDGSTLLALSDGTLLTWRTEPGRCHLRVLARGAADLELDTVEDASEDPDKDPDEDTDESIGTDTCADVSRPGTFESDLLTIDGALRWIVHAGTCTPTATIRVERRS